MRLILTSLMIALFAGLDSQTAQNWTANDCSGNSHELFTELDAGKAVVMIWVMPCANCINQAHSAQTEVQNALTANPGKIVYYLVDDYGNTNCATLQSWCTTNGITDPIVMSSAAISMNPYGGAGMPKVIVLGRDHKVYYNKNGSSVNAAGIKDGITAALAAPTGITKNPMTDVIFGVSPNPSYGTTKINVSVDESSEIRIEVLNALGQLIANVKSGQLSRGSHEFIIDTSEWPNGTYIVNAVVAGKKIQEKLIVAH